MTRDAIFTWFDDVFTGKVDPKKGNFGKQVSDTEIALVLNNTMIGNRENYRELVLSEGYDTLLLLYTTENLSNVQRNIALQFNIVADAFIQLRMTKTVRCVSYDVNVHSFPEGIEYTLDLPQIYFFPAYNKHPPFLKYIGEGVAAHIL